MRTDVAKNHSPRIFPEGWDYPQLKELATIKYGKNLSTKKLAESGYPVFGANGVIGYYDRYLYEEPQVLISCRGAYSGKINWSPRTCFITNNSLVLEVPNGQEELKRYLFYALQAIDKSKLISGTAQPQVTINNAEVLQIPLAPKNRRKAVVAEIEKQFSRLDEAVANLKRVKANLKRYKAAVLKAAVEGKLTDEWRQAHPDVEPANELLRRILAERRAEWNGKGKYKEPNPPNGAAWPLPKNWTWATVEQMSSLVQYGSSAKTSEDPTGIPVLRMGNIIEGQLQITELKYLPKSHDEFPALLLEPGDVLFNRTNSAELVGKTALYRGHPKPCSFASYLIRVRLLNGCLPEFLVYYINSVFGRGWISSVVSQQVGQANVNGTKLQALVVSLPPFAEQEIIVAEVERRMCLLGNLDNAIDASFARAERLRQSTLSRMFNGEAYSPRRVVTVNTGR